MLDLLIDILYKYLLSVRSCLIVSLNFFNGFGVDSTDLI